MADQVAAPAKAKTLRRFLLALVGRVCDHPRLVLALAVLLAALSCAAAWGRLEYHTSRNDLISSRKGCQQRWKRFLDEFGDDDDIVVVVQGGDHEAMQQALDGVAARLAGRPDLFDRIFYKVDLRSLRDRALLLAPLAQIQTLHADYLADLRPLLDFPLSWYGLGLHGIVLEARTRLGRLADPKASLSPSDERFLRQLVSVSRSAREGLADPTRSSSPWGSLLPGKPDQDAVLQAPRYFFSADGQVAFLLVRPVKEAGSFTAALNSVRAARSVITEARAAHPGLRFGLTGMPVLETDEMVAAEHDTRLASWLAIACVLLLFLVVYRGVYYPLLTVATLLVGTAWALGWLTLTVGHLNILSATFAVMLVGMGDYGVLWVMRYENARREGVAVRAALLHTTSHVAVGNLTAAATLALAFFAALFADFKAVGELGWIAGCGVLLCAFACFTVLPALLVLFDRRPPGSVGVLQGPRLFDPAAGAPRGADAWLPGLVRRPALVLGAGAALTAALAFCASLVRYDHNLLHLQAQGLESVRWEMTLIEHTAGASWHALSFTASRQEAMALAEKYRRLPEVSQVVEAASLAPPDQDAKLPLVADIHARLANLPRRGATIPHARPDVAVLRDDLAGLLAELGPLCKGRGAGEAWMADLHRAVAELCRAVGDAPAGQAAVRLQQFDQRLAQDMAENLHKLRDVSTPRPIGLADLPAGVRERYVGRTGKWLLRVFARDDLWDFEPLEHFTRTIHGVDPEATGKPFGTVEGLEAMKNGLGRAGLYAFGVIVLVLFLDFRGLGLTLLALMPLVLGVVLSLGVLGLLGRPLNPANMIAFPLILGVGVDNGVHVLHDHLLRRREGKAGVSAAIGRGVLVKALTTMIGFGTLIVSTERGLAGLGFILTLGVGCSMLSALVLLPAALALIERLRPLPQQAAGRAHPAAADLPGKAAA